MLFTLKDILAFPPCPNCGQELKFNIRGMNPEKSAWSHPFQLRNKELELKIISTYWMELILFINLESHQLKLDRLIFSDHNNEQIQNYFNETIFKVEAFCPTECLVRLSAPLQFDWDRNLLKPISIDKEILCFDYRFFLETNQNHSKLTIVNLNERGWYYPHYETMEWNLAWVKNKAEVELNPLWSFKMKKEQIMSKIETYAFFE